MGSPGSAPGCGRDAPLNRKNKRRRVNGRSSDFGLTQRPFQRLGGGQDPFPGRHGVVEDGHSALMEIIPSARRNINRE
jgi:hypothetical protein